MVLCIERFIQGKLKLYVFSYFTFDESKISIKYPDLKISFFHSHELGFKVRKNSTPLKMINYTNKFVLAPLAIS